MSDKLRIGFISADDANDITSWSGTPYHILQALRRQDATIEVFSPLREDFRYLLAPLKIAARMVKKDVIFNNFPVALRSYAAQLRKKLRQTPVDVLLSIGSPPIAMLECPQPIVFFTDAVFHLMHGYYGGKWDRLTAASLRRGNWLEEQALKRCSIGAYSSNWAAEAARKYTAPNKIRVVHFGASLQVKHDAEIIKRWAGERVAGMHSQCRLLLIGVEWARKGGGIAVEATRLLREMGVNAKLTVVGCHPDEEVDEKYVELLGFVNKRTPEGQKKLEDLYRRANFFILPSRAEASAIVFCEASAFGLPTIAFDTGGVRDYVRDGINGMCLPLDSTPKRFASSIKEIMADKERYSALCLGAFQEYKDRLNWDTTASALVKLCHEAVRDR